MCVPTVDELLNQLQASGKSKKEIGTAVGHQIKQYLGCKGTNPTSNSAYRGFYKKALSEAEFNKLGTGRVTLLYCNTTKNLIAGRAPAGLAEAAYHWLHFGAGGDHWGRSCAIEIDVALFGKPKFSQPLEDAELVAEVEAKAKTTRQAIDDNPEKLFQDKLAAIARNPPNAGTPGPQPHLSPAAVATNITHYSYAADPIGLLGRDDEQAPLRRFLVEPGAFRWLQLAGVAGQGKSRLAYEFMRLALKANWKAGFLDTETLTTFAWKTWQPEGPHLLIVDYVLGREEAIGKMIRPLALLCQEAGMHRVRLLLLERQRFDRGGLALSPSVGGARDEWTQSEGHAEWFLKLSDHHDGRDPDLLDARFDTGLIELETLKSEHLVAITKWVAAREAKATGRPELTLSDDRIAAQLAHIDKAGRPLYAYFLGRVLDAQSERLEWSRDKLLDEVLKKDKQTRWKHAFSGDASRLGHDCPEMRLALLANMAGLSKGIDCNDLGARLEEAFQSTVNNFHKTDVRDRAIVLNDGPRGADIGLPTLIPAMQPDLLAEWFVLSCLVDRVFAADLAVLAWRAEPAGMAAFLQRLSQDFPDHPVTMLLLDQTLPDDESKTAYSKIANTILVSLHKAKHSFPTQLIIALRRAAEAGDGWAMVNVGFRYIEGVGVERDFKAGFKWRLSAADCGIPAAMNGLGSCYEFGFGVKKDWIAAAHWYRRGAEAGDGPAMGNLGVCYEYGTGVERDTAAAVAWYRRSAHAGEKTAMAILGTCYERGIGVEQDLSMAVDCYRQGSKAGDGLAMAHLGVCYQYGIGVEKSISAALEWYSLGATAGDGHAMACLGIFCQKGIILERDISGAIEWYRKGAETKNSGLAMTCLGLCYEQGIGTPRNVSLALEWYREGVYARYGGSMYRLGLCYERGVGVEKDLATAVYWYQRGADAGDHNAMNSLGQNYECGTGVKKFGLGGILV